MGVKLKTVKAMDDFILEAEFVDGTVKRYDVKPLFEEIEDFKQLKEQPELFQAPEIVCCGEGVAWGDSLDVACEEIWDNGITV